MAEISGPGKFSDTLDAYLWEVSLDGGADEETGDNSMGPAWYGIMRGPMTDAEIDSFDASELDSEDRETLRSMAGVILCETSDGFVSADIYVSTVELELEWSAVLAETEENESDE